MKIDPYLMFDGNCAEAMRFYERALKGKLERMFTYAEVPEGTPCPTTDGSRIMHACLNIGDQRIMASDDTGGRFEPMKGLWVSLNLGSIAEAERVFGELSQGANVIMPIQETFWAARFAMLVDRFGTPWMVNCDKQPA